MQSLNKFLAEKLEAKPLKSVFGNPWYEIRKDNYYCQIMRFDGPSKHGIDGGKISKLSIREDPSGKDPKHGQELVAYDRGWSTKPSGKVKKFYDEIIKEYN